MPDNKILVKRILSDFLGFLRYKVDNDKLTLEEEQAIVRIIEENLPLSGTSDDFARYYKQSPVNVRSVINRKMIDKPRRLVLYPFLKFSKIVPEKWRVAKK
jgi:hypothetical protein